MYCSTPGFPVHPTYSSSCPLSWWCHPIISSSVVPFSFHLQSFLTSGSFSMNQFFTSDGQSIGSFSFSISPSNEYSGLTSFRIDWLAREFQKNIYFCFIDYTKAFDCVDHNKLCKFPKEMGIPDHLTCLLRNLYAWTWNNRLVPNRERSTLRVYIVTLLI